MAATAKSSLPSRWARAPFYFNSAAHLLRISRDKAMNLQELLDAVRTCSDACIFQHTFQTLEEHHFIREGFSNDFSHWAFSACNEVELAERLAGLDVREFTSIASLREQVVRLVEDYLRKYPRAATRTAMEPFYLMASEVVVVLWALHLSIHFVTILVIEGVTRGLKMLSGWIPARLGSDEGGAISAFALIGFSPMLGLALALTRRVRDLLWAFIGIVLLAWSSRRARPSQDTARPINDLAQEAF